MSTAALINEKQHVCFEAKLSAGKITSDGFADTTLITGNAEALGHGLFVDEKSIEGCVSLLMGKTLPAYLTHSGAWNDRLGKEIGVFSGFYRDGAKVKASKFSFLNSFKKFQAATYETMVELAQTVPDQFGLSVVFSGDAAWVCPDGTEMSADESMPESVVRPVPSIRFQSIESADFVKSPAANPDGLFQAKIDKPNTSMATTTIELAKHNELLAAKDAELAEIKKLHVADCEKLKADHKTALDAANAKALEALAAKELAEKAAAEVPTLKKSIDALTAERDDAKKFDVRLSGTGTVAALGATVTTTGAALPAPAQTDQEKWAQHAELAKKDPKLAADFYALHIKRK